MLTELDPEVIYVVGGLIDRKKIKGASMRRASTLGIRCARLPLMENLSSEQRASSNSLDALNVNSVFRILVEWCACRSWPEALTRALSAQQRGFGAWRGDESRDEGPSATLLQAF